MKFRFILTTAAVVMVSGCTQVGQSDNGPAPVPIGPGTLNVADAAIAGGDPSMALSVTQSVLANDPHNVDALVHEGDAYYALSRCNSAEAAYQLALTYDAKSTASEVGLGRCLLKTDPKAAEAALLLAVQDDPGNAAAFNDLGISRDLQGNFAGAVAPYQRALQADPALTAAEVNLGLSLALSGNGAAALQYLGPLATGQGATPKIREDYAAALVASGRDSEARQVLSVDLPPDQVNDALQGFAAVIVAAQPPLPPAAAPVAVASSGTASGVQLAPVAASALPGSTAMTPVAIATPPEPAAPVSAQVVSLGAVGPDNATAAYTGPSPVPGAISSSTPGPGVPGVSPKSAQTNKIAASESTASSTAVSSFKTAVSTGAPVAAPPVPDPSQTSVYKVQLAALNSQSDAQSAWSKMSSNMPALFGDKQPDIETATVNGKTYYRLRVGGFASKTDAAKFCGEVSAAGTTCTLANF